MEILSANIRDLNALRQLERDCFEKDAWPLFDLIAVLTFSGVIRLKAVEEDRMIGFVAGDPRPSQGFAWIATICVSPEHQRMGIGRTLLRACEARIKTPRLKLSVRASNHPAIRLYEAEGYCVTDVWKGYYDDGENALVMEKAHRADIL